MIVRHHLVDERTCFVVGCLTIDEQFTDIFSQVIANRPEDDAVFLIEQLWCRLLRLGSLNCLPQLYEVIQVPLQFFCATADSNRTNDHAHALRDVELTHRFAQLIPVFTLDLPRDTPDARIVRHEHHVATSQADEGGQCGAFRAAFFFIDLDDKFLTFTDQLLNDQFVAAVGLLFEILAGDFFQREKAVAVGPVIDKCGFEAWFDSSDTCFVDTGFFLFPADIFDVEVVEFLSVDEGNPDFFGLRGVDQHSFHAFGFQSTCCRGVPQGHRLGRQAA